MNKKQIYTIGHSNRGIEEFINLLKENKINLLVDIRRFPVSKKFPHFEKENLKEKLENKGIKYVWMGEFLGGFRKEGYIKYMETKNFKKGISELINLNKLNKKVVIMCKEKLWFKCHRKFISIYLKQKNYKIIHIIDKNKIYENK